MTGEFDLRIYRDCAVIASGKNEMYKFVQTINASRNRSGQRTCWLHITGRCRRQFVANWVQNRCFPPIFRHRACSGRSTAYALLFIQRVLLPQVVQRPLNHPGKRGGGRIANSLQNARQLGTHSRRSGSDNSPIGYTFPPIGHGLLANWVHILADPVRITRQLGTHSCQSGTDYSPIGYKSAAPSQCELIAVVEFKQLNLRQREIDCWCHAANSGQHPGQLWPAAGSGVGVFRGSLVQVSQISTLDFRTGASITVGSCQRHFRSSTGKSAHPTALIAAQILRSCQTTGASQSLPERLLKSSSNASFGETSPTTNVGSLSATYGVCQIEDCFIRRGCLRSRHLKNLAAPELDSPRPESGRESRPVARCRAERRLVRRILR
ncbi:MAG: hypothetical protein JWM11_4065 [Planctomycetaceae bacterium]|nr:hypothetical protein [Planctomycetaceae bacterium]